MPGNDGVTCVIVADDLTGAADACATFVQRGLSGAVTLDAARAHRADVLAISTDSRRLSAAEASERVGAAIQRLAPGYDHAVPFKKVDSTLGGHIGEELAAAMTAWNAERAILAPAFPAMGRTVEGGVLRVVRGGVPIADPLARHLPTLLASQGLAACRLIARPSEASRSDTWTTTVQAALGSHARVLVCDAACDADLDAIVDAAWAAERVVWVGSAGLAGALARRLAPSAAKSGPPAAARRLGWRRQGAVLFWIGSNQAVTVEQCRRLLNDSSARVLRVRAQDTDVLSRYLREGRHVLVDSGPDVPDDVLAECVRVAASREIAAFVMSGGDTAGRVCRMLDIERIDVGGEVATGIPWGCLHARAGQRWGLVLKAGGFGSGDALIQALTFLTTHGDADV